MSSREMLNDEANACRKYLANDNRLDVFLPSRGGRFRFAERIVAVKCAQIEPFRQFWNIIMITRPDVPVF